MDFSFFKSIEEISGFILITDKCYNVLLEHYGTIKNLKGKTFNKAFELSLTNALVDDFFLIGTEESLPLIAANHYRFNEQAVGMEKNLHKVKVKIPKSAYRICTDNGEIILTGSIIIEDIDANIYNSTPADIINAMSVLTKISNSKCIKMIYNSLGYDEFKEWSADLFLYTILYYKYSKKDYIALIDKFGSENLIPLNFRRKVIWATCLIKNHKMCKALQETTPIAIFNNWGLSAMILTKFDNFSKWYLNKYTRGNDLDDEALGILIRFGGIIKSIKALLYVTYYKQRGDNR